MKPVTSVLFFLFSLTPQPGRALPPPDRLLAVIDQEKGATGSLTRMGEFGSVNGTSKPKLARLTSSCALNINSYWFYLNINSVTANRIARISLWGTLDPYFDATAGPNSSVYSLTFSLSVRQVFAAGAFSQFNGANQGRLVRLHGK